MPNVVRGFCPRNKRARRLLSNPVGKMTSSIKLAPANGKFVLAMSACDNDIV